MLSVCVGRACICIFDLCLRQPDFLEGLPEDHVAWLGHGQPSWDQGYDWRESKRWESDHAWWTKPEWDGYGYYNYGRQRSWWDQDVGSTFRLRQATKEWPQCEALEAPPPEPVVPAEGTHEEPGQDAPTNISIDDVDAVQKAGSCQLIDSYCVPNPKL